MTDDIIKSFYQKHFKEWFKKNNKFLLTILLYLLYQSNFIISVITSFGININNVPKNPRLFLFFLSDLTYVILLFIIFKKDIKKGIKDLKENFLNRAILSLNCWIIGCLLMTISSILISFLSKQSFSTNEALVRQSIKIAPFYMLFTCSLVAPIFEELVFRKSLCGLIKFKWLFIFLSGLSFGLLHVIGSYNTPIDFLYVIPYGSMGCAFAYLLTKTNNIVLPILIHMLHNTLLVLSQIIGG